MIQEITGELRAFGALVCPKSTRCATLKELRSVTLKDAVVNEIFCMSRFTSRAPSLGVHPGFAIDCTTRWDVDEPDQEAEAFRPRVPMRPRLLVVSPECKRWSQLQNLSKDSQLSNVKRTLFSRPLEAVAQMYHGQVDDHNYFLHEHS